MDDAARHIESRNHHRERFFFAILSFAHGEYGFVRIPITRQVIPADAFDRDDVAGVQQMDRRL